MLDRDEAKKEVADLPPVHPCEGQGVRRLRRALQTCVDLYSRLAKRDARIGRLEKALEATWQCRGCDLYEADCSGCEVEVLRLGAAR